MSGAGRRDYSLAELADALVHVDPHERETWVRMGMALKAEFGESAFEIWDSWSAQAANYDARDAKSVWRSFKRGGRVTIGTLVHEARAAGWQPWQEPSAEQQEHTQAEREARRRERERQEEEAEAQARAWQERIAALAQRCLEEGVLAPTGRRAPYLGQKKVRACGVRFVRRPALLLVDEATQSTRIVTGSKELKDWFATDERQRESLSVRYLKAGTVAVPMRDAEGRLWGWQFILPEKGTKKFLKHGRKSGCFHLLGEMDERLPLAIAEGYATAASVHEATGWPVAVCFDAGNLLPVAQALRERYSDARILVCGDDDHETKGNPGRKYACRATGEVGGRALFPRFREPGGRTDWNDLQHECGLGAVREQLLAGQAGAEPEAEPGDASDSSDPPEPEADWRDLLVRQKHGGLQESLHNLVTILENDPAWVGLYAFDEFANQVQRRRRTPYGYEAGPLEDADGGEVTAWLGDPRNFGLSVKSRLALEAVELVAHRRQFHPVRAYLDSLRWDGEERLTHLLSDFFGAPYDEYTAAVGRNWLMSAVARVREPGCKVDFMVILEGAQGVYKSTAVRTLCGPDWFAEIMESPQSKDFFQTLPGRWIVEIPELQSFNKADRNKIKAAVSAQEDTYRPSYGRYSRQFPRQNIFVGTTNDDMYLKDETGARRFMPVRCGEIDIKALAAQRDQLWAEADARFRRGERYWDFPAQAVEEQDARFDSDVWEEPVAEWIAGHGDTSSYPHFYPPVHPDRPVKATTTYDVMRWALKIETPKLARQDQMRVAAILRRLRFSRSKNQLTWGGGWRVHVYRRE